MPNIRIRQRLKAEEIVAKSDPIILASIKADKNFRRCLILRKSEYEQYKERHGDDLKVIYGDV